MKTIVLLFYEFFKTGLFSIGGGLATLPFLTQMSIKSPDWFSSPTLADIVAIAESTPGPIGVNAATFAGFSAAGVIGSVTATFGLVLPSFIIICIIARFFEKYRNSRLVKDAFDCVRPTVTGLVASAGFVMLKLSLLPDGSFSTISSVTWISLSLFALLIVFTQLKWTKNLHPVVIIVIGAIAGVVLSL